MFSHLSLSLQSLRSKSFDHFIIFSAYKDGDIVSEELRLGTTFDQIVDLIYGANCENVIAVYQVTVDGKITSSADISMQLAESLAQRWHDQADEQGFHPWLHDFCCIHGYPLKYDDSEERQTRSDYAFDLGVAQGRIPTYGFR